MTDLEIKTYLDKVGLKYAVMSRDGDEKPYVEMWFATSACRKGDFKRNLRCSLEDAVSLLQDYIRKIDEN